jgi:Zn-finger nucleic acid-binding protein
MKCPVCNTPDLLMTERQGIEIDYCPTCRGVWLDRGELDKLAVRGDEDLAAANRGRPRDEYRRDEYRREDSDHRRDKVYREQREPYKRKKSLFGELFDFG